MLHSCGHVKLAVQAASGAFENFSMALAPASSSSSEEFVPLPLLHISAAGRLQFRCRLLVNTHTRWLNAVLQPTLQALLGSRRGAGLLLCRLQQKTIAALSAACWDILQCLQGAFGQRRLQWTYLRHRLTPGGESSQAQHGPDEAGNSEKGF